MELHKKIFYLVEWWCCSSYWKELKKNFSPFGLLISMGTYGLLPAFLSQTYIQNRTIILTLSSDILRSFPQSFVVFFFLVRVPLVSLMFLSVHPVIYSVRQLASDTEKSNKKGRGQTCDIFWAMYVYVTQQGSFPSKMEIAFIAAAVSSDGWRGWKEQLGRQLSTVSVGFMLYLSHWLLMSILAACVAS